MRNEQVKDTRRPPLRLLLACGMATALFAACEQGPSPGELAAQAENARLTGDLQGRDSLISEMTRSFDEIETNIQMMDDRERVLVTNTSEQPAHERLDEGKP